MPHLSLYIIYLISDVPTPDLSFYLLYPINLRSGDCAGHCMSFLFLKILSLIWICISGRCRVEISIDVEFYHEHVATSSLAIYFYTFVCLFVKGPKLSPEKQLHTITLLKCSETVFRIQSATDRSSNSSHSIRIHKIKQCSIVQVSISSVLEQI